MQDFISHRKKQLPEAGGRYVRFPYCLLQRLLLLFVGAGVCCLLFVAYAYIIISTIITIMFVTISYYYYYYYYYYQNIKISSENEDAGDASLAFSSPPWY
jgi:hypothetical protein